MNSANLLISCGSFSVLGRRLHDDFCDVPLDVASIEEVQSELMISRVGVESMDW